MSQDKMSFIQTAYFETILFSPLHEATCSEKAAEFVEIIPAIDICTWNVIYKWWLKKKK